VVIVGGQLVKTSVGLQVEGGLVPWDVWMEMGDQLRVIEGAVQFWIGDWLNYGESAYGEKYAQAIDPAQAKTWANYAYVSKSIQPSLRREAVSYSKHAMLASLSPSDQEKFLNECEANGYTAKELRSAIKGETPVHTQHECPKCGHKW
jgi:hypothetical protein